MWVGVTFAALKYVSTCFTLVVGLVSTTSETHEVNAAGKRELTKSGKLYIWLICISTAVALSSQVLEQVKTNNDTRIAAAKAAKDQAQATEDVKHSIVDLMPLRLSFYFDVESAKPITEEEAKKRLSAIKDPFGIVGFSNTASAAELTDGGKDFNGLLRGAVFAGKLSIPYGIETYPDKTRFAVESEPASVDWYNSRSGSVTAFDLARNEIGYRVHFNNWPPDWSIKRCVVRIISGKGDSARCELKPGAAFHQGSQYEPFFWGRGPDPSDW